MNEIFCCPGTGNNEQSIQLCAGLAALKQEHISLRQKMEKLYLVAEEIAESKQSADWGKDVMILHELTSRFNDQLDPHSVLEEDFLFPMMAAYIGRNSGPVAVMEFEHDNAKQNLQDFFNGIKQLNMPAGEKEAKKLANYVMEACSILACHFMKEESVLFPMAQQMLSAEEKARLDQKFVRG